MIVLMVFACLMKYFGDGPFWPVEIPSADPCKTNWWTNTFNNISAISWRSVLLVEETGENHRPAASHSQTLSHNVVTSTPRHEQGLNSQL
jgi:hypothetical protein